MLTVIVISDEPLVEVGFRSVVRQDPELEMMCVCESVAQFVRLDPVCEPDLIVSVLRPDAELGIADLRHRSPRSSIILLARDFSPEFAHQALSMGVRGFLSAFAPADQIADCLRSVARGELWMEKALSMRLLETRPVTLSRRQKQIIGLLAQGLKNKEIGTALGIAEGTVKAYLTVLFEKLGAKDRFELALFGLKNINSFKEYGTAPRLSSRTSPGQQSKRWTVA